MPKSKDPFVKSPLTMLPKEINVDLTVENARSEKSENPSKILVLFVVTVASVSL